MKPIEISKYPIEVLDCPDNIESIEITIEEVINQYDDHNFLKTVKRKISENKWRIVAGLIIICAIVIGLCIFFLTNETAKSKPATMETANISNIETYQTSTEGIVLPTNMGIQTITTTAKNIINTTKRRAHIDEILNPM